MDQGKPAAGTGEEVDAPLPRLRADHSATGRLCQVAGEDGDAVRNIPHRCAVTFVAPHFVTLQRPRMLSPRERYAAMLRWSPVMVRMAAISAILLGVALIGLLVDDRVITGAPAWLKPAKFGLSGAVYLVTMAWMVRDLQKSRLLRIATTLIGWILALETGLIALQAMRGTTSHFNIDTPLNAVIYSSMGVGIATVWVMSAILLWLHLRTPATDRTMALALRIGLALNIAGAGVGWTMTQPREDQLAAMKRGERPWLAGTHTIGAPDGGPGLPLTTWSRSHGDLRIPHFLGMHAWQLLPLLLLGLRRIRSATDDNTERTAIVFASLACGGLFLAALAQALAGHPLLPFPTS